MKYAASLTALMISTLAAWQPAQAAIIGTLTATARLDTATTTKITYTMYGAADVGTQDISSYFFRVVLIGNLPLTNLQGGLGSNFLAAPVGSPFAGGPGSPWTSISVTPNFNQVRWQSASPGSSSRTIDTVGGVVGSFDMTWIRPASGQYDVSLPISAITTAYVNAPNDVFASLITGTSSFSSDVSTLITAVGTPNPTFNVPEPGTPALLLGALLAMGATAGLRRRGGAVSAT